MLMNAVRAACAAAAAAGAGGPYVGDAATFDGTNDWMTLGAALGSDGSEFTFSGWVNLNGGDGSQQFLARNGGSTWHVIRLPNNEWQVRGTTSGGSPLVLVQSSNNWTSASGWHHILASGRSSGTAVGHLYINDADASDALEKQTNNGTIDFADTNYRVGANMSGGERLNADVFDLWFAQSYIDISNEANRRLFIDADGKPVDLGADGSNPGVTPVQFHHLDDGEAVANFALNRGSGNDFTITGTLATGTTSPTDP